MNSSSQDFLSNATEPSGSTLDFGQLPNLLLDFLLASTAAVANSILLLAIHKNPHRDLRSPSTNLVINLAVADFMAGFLSGSFLTARDTLLFIDRSKHTARVQNLLTVIIYIGIASIIVGCCNVIAMAFDRWLAVSSAMNYRNKVTARRINVAIVLFWTYAALFTSFFFVRAVPFNVFELLFCHLHVSFPLLVLPIVYWKTFRALEAHSRRMKNLEPDSERTTLKTVQREKKTTKAFVIVLCLFYVAFAPYVVAINLRYLCSVCEGSEAFIVFIHISLKFILLNSSLDPFVYAWRIPKYQRAVRTILNRYCCSRRRRNNTIDPAEIQGTSLGDNLGQETATNTNLQLNSTNF